MLDTSINLLIKELQKSKIQFIENEPLKNHTSFKIGGPSRIFAVPKNTEEIKICIGFAKKNSVPTYILGKGSNILFTDEGYNGLIIYIADNYSSISVNENIVTADAGAQLSKVCLFAQKHDLAGLEFAYGIPGSIGGAIYMNAGAYGGEMKDVVTTISYITPNGEILSLDNSQANFSYRNSIFQTKPWCILSASFTLPTGNKKDILDKMNELMERRVEKQPLELPSAGSAFKRPEGAFASALIDQSGLRGFNIGDAAISEKHCGFIVNLGNATCEDILNLADTVSGIVKEKTGFELEKEIRVVNKDENYLNF